MERISDKNTEHQLIDLLNPIVGPKIMQESILALKALKSELAIDPLISILNNDDYYRLSNGIFTYDNLKNYPPRLIEKDSYNMLLSAAETLEYFERDDIAAISAIKKFREYDHYRTEKILQSKLEEGNIKWKLRGLILKSAAKISFTDHIEHLSDIGAVRAIQRQEGNTPCFASDIPPKPKPDDRLLCNESNCLWIGYCNLYRSEIRPLDKVFPDLSKREIDRASNNLVMQIKKDDYLLPDNVVGIKVRSFNRIPAVSRKMLLSTPTSIFTEATDNPHSLIPYLVHLGTDSPYCGGRVGHVNYSWDIIFTSNIVALNAWLSNASIFLENGNLGYWPLHTQYRTGHYLDRATYVSGVCSGYFDEVHKSILTPEIIGINTFDANHLGFQDGDIMLTDPNFAPILHFDLPTLERIDFDTLYKLMRDYPEELATFRDYLSPHIEKMRLSAVGSESFYKECKRIERNIRDQLRKVNSSYRKTKIQSAFSVAGCAVASWTLALYCIVKGAGDILTILGPGGVAYTISSEYSKYIGKQLELRESPVYFLWKIGRSEPKK